MKVEFAIVGGGFGGIGMAIALKRSGRHDFVILERSSRPGGVWRDNTYPGAGCDVPSHLYCFSFAPNPEWSRVFAGQAEIDAYLARCVDDYGLAPHFRCDADVRSIVFDDAAGRWTAGLVDGSTIDTRIVVAATGQLSLPAYPAVEGRGELKIPAFHSARWDHGQDLSGKRVAVLGTGASVIQFVPPVAREAATVTVFQRSPAYVIPRDDRLYSSREKDAFRRSPLKRRLHRLRLYLQYEMRALLFARSGGLLRWLVRKSFVDTLAADVPDPDLRRRLTPDYPVGCKRILVSDDYFKALARSNVHVVETPVARFTFNGVATTDGHQREFDAVIFGTGFRATSFLSPMEVRGRFGIELNAAWRDGAAAYLGMTVPGFPNFFILYGPNTNLGHNSIIFMLETQIAHVVRCLDAMRRRGATSIEVEKASHDAADVVTQRKLARSIWAGCTSWYLDAAGRNTTNLPGYTFSYRRRAKRSSLDAYRFTVRDDVAALALTVLPPRGFAEFLGAAATRALLRSTFRVVAGPPFAVATQRRVLSLLGAANPPSRNVEFGSLRADGVEVEIVTPRERRPGAILYLHGGAFCVGGPKAFRSLTSRLAEAARLPVWVPDYRLAPEHPYPAGVLDALAAWRALRATGVEADRIVVAGDSAGGSLALALTLRLRALGEKPAGLALVSPVVDLLAEDVRSPEGARGDPVIRPAWLRQCLGWYAAPASASDHRPLDADLADFPPMLVQVGSDEILFDQSRRLARHATACGVECHFEIYADRWHDFHLQATTLRSSTSAIAALGLFASVRATPPSGRTGSSEPIARPASERINAS